jgi:hypothetical protein
LREVAKHLGGAAHQPRRPWRAERRTLRERC